MNHSIKLLDKYVETCKHASDSAAARALKVQPSAVNNWRHGRAKPSAETIERMCDATGEPLREWLPLIEAERARTPGDRKVWLRMAQTTTAIAIVIGLNAFGHIDVQTLGVAWLTPVYIMRNLRALIMAFGKCSAWCPAWLMRSCGHGLRHGREHHGDFHHIG